MLTYLHGLFPQVKTEINRLIDEHQKLPGNIARGLMERVIEWPKSKAS